MPDLDTLRWLLWLGFALCIAYFCIPDDKEDE